MLLTSRAADIVHTPAVSGVPASFMRQSLEAAGFDMAALQGKGEVNFGSKLKPLSDEAKAWKTVWSAGQGVGDIDDLPSVDQLVARLDDEYREALERATQLREHWPR
jgi:nitronate monooxygenase